MLCGIIHSNASDELYGKRPMPVKNYLAGKKSIKKIIRNSGELLTPIICDIIFNRHIRRPSINILNSGRWISNLPEHGVIEVPAYADNAGIHPEKVGSIPEIWAAYIRTQYSIHYYLTEALKTGRKKFLLQALLLDPVINDCVKAEKMLNEMLDIQKDFLPQFR